DARRRHDRMGRPAPRRSGRRERAGHRRSRVVARPARGDQQPRAGRRLGNLEVTIAMWDGFSTRPPPKAAAFAAADGLRTRPTLMRGRASLLVALVLCGAAPRHEIHLLPRFTS